MTITKILVCDDYHPVPAVFLASSNNQSDRLWAMMQGGKNLTGKPHLDEQILEKIKG